MYVKAFQYIVDERCSVIEVGMVVFFVFLEKVVTEILVEGNGDRVALVDTRVRCIVFGGESGSGRIVEPCGIEVRIIQVLVRSVVHDGLREGVHLQPHGCQRVAIIAGIVQLENRVADSLGGGRQAVVFRPVNLCQEVSVEFPEVFFGELAQIGRTGP